jgi:hypothetical protein
VGEGERGTDQMIRLDSSPISVGREPRSRFWSSSLGKHACPLHSALRLLFALSLEAPCEYVMRHRWGDEDAHGAQLRERAELSWKRAR